MLKTEGLAPLTHYSWGRQSSVEATASFFAAGGLWEGGTGIGLSEMEC